jgi:hypothetical protein
MITGRDDTMMRRGGLLDARAGAIMHDGRA